MQAKVDGRRARGVRTRAAIVEALLDLVAEGEITPTAQRIADRAGVSVRSVYQHFTDVEGLFAEASERAREMANGRRPVTDPALPLEQRIDELVMARSSNLEALLPFARAARLLEPSSDILRRNRVTLERKARDELGKVFRPELAELGPAARRQTLNALDLLTNLAAWEHLRSNGVSVRAAREVMRGGVLALLLGLPEMAA